MCTRQCMMLWLTIVVWLCASPCVSGSWSSDDFALYDLVEEVNVNFYEFFEVDQNASLADIKKSYRRLSLLWHPDKNSAPDAANKFRQLAAMYEVLKLDTMRAKYDQVLEFGLPDWRQPVFYYRSIRRMPVWEMIIILMLIVTTAQYLMHWGSYMERKMIVTQQVEKELRKQERKLRKSNIDVDVLINGEVSKKTADERPRLCNLLPFMLARGTYAGVRALPGAVVQLTVFLMEKARPKKVEEDDEPDTNANVPRTARAERVEYAMANGVRPVSTMGVADSMLDEPVLELKTGAWTVDEVNLLVRLSTYKYPMGTPARWERIGQQLQRRSDDVTTMIGRLKHVDPKDYDKLIRGEHIERAWSGYEQMLLEEALTKCPKSLGAERWTRIAEWLPGRTKEECIARYKAIVQQIKAKRQKEQPDAENVSSQHARPEQECTDDAADAD